MTDLFDAAIFDLDGTILDSMGVWEKIDHSFLKEKRGIDVPADYVEKISAMSFREIAEYTKKRFNLADTPEGLMEEWTNMALYEYSHNIKLKDDAGEYIAFLKKKGKKIVLCTSSPLCFYESALKNNGIYHLFDAFTNTCEAGEGKNSPKVFLLAAEKANAAPSRCMVFEDVFSAAQTAKSAGMYVCGVFDERSNSDRKKMEELCDFYIESFKKATL